MRGFGQASSAHRMKLQVPFIQLPVLFDPGPLLHEATAVADRHWQRCADGGERLRLVSSGGDAASGALSGPMRATPFLRQMPLLQQALAGLGATWGQVFLQRIAVGRQYAAEVAVDYYHRERLRLHLPLASPPDVLLECGDEVAHLAPGTAWVFDTWRPHRFAGPAQGPCLHLVADTVGGERFWELLTRGRTPGRAKREPWQPLQLTLASDQRAALALEAHGAPQVMTPWELREHLMFLLNEAVPHPRLAGLQVLLLRLSRHWHALWARHGAEAAGRPAYRALLASTAQACQQLGVEQLVLRNGIGLWPALQAQVLDVAVAEEDGLRRGGARKSEAPPTGAPTVATPKPRSPPTRLRQPLFVVAAPCSGAGLVARTLAQAPGLYAAGEEARRAIDGIQRLAAPQRADFSHRLLAGDAVEDTVRRVRERLARGLRGHDGRPVPAAGGTVRLLRADARDALRVPFLAQAFPDARFVFVHREPHDALGSLLRAWEEGRMQDAGVLPGWEGPAWTLARPPGWQALSGLPLETVVAGQWSGIMRVLLDDLAQLPPERWLGLDLDRLLADPDGEMQRVAGFAGLEWSLELGQTLPRAQPPASPSSAERWRPHAVRLQPVLGDVPQRALEASFHG